MNLFSSTRALKLYVVLTSPVSRMIGQGDELAHSNVSPSTRQWLLNFIILLCGLFFVLTYEATMTYAPFHTSNTSSTSSSALSCLLCHTQAPFC